MADEASPIRWSSTMHLAEVREIVRLGETQIGDLLALALAADARANTLAYTLATVSAGLLVAGLTLANIIAEPVAAAIGAFASAAVFLGAAGVAMWASRPVDFSIRGFDPANLGSRNADELQLGRWTAEDLAARIERNRAALNRTAQLTKCAQRLSLVAVLAGLTCATVTGPVGLAVVRGGCAALRLWISC